MSHNLDTGSTTAHTLYYLEQIFGPFTPEERRALYDAYYNRGKGGIEDGD